ncbi:ATP-grasp domain-containing protein [Micromonospora chokoriensis]
MKKILFVHAKGGVPLEHAIPRLGAAGDLHLLTLAPLPAGEWRAHCGGIIDHSGELVRGEDLVNLIITHAKAVGADAVVGFSEYVLLAVAHACDRLGLPGPGRNTVLSRDKRLMRERWAERGVPIPAFRRVGTADDLLAAYRELTPPLLLKPAWGAGSIGQAVIEREADVTAAWESVSGALHQLDDHGIGERYETGAPRHLLAEEIIKGTVDGWYDRPGYGDYLSVEGIVARGTFHPIVITGRIPTIAPFTELSSHAPCALSEPLQRRVEDVARQAVDALALDTCGTHTEIKLCADGRLSVIESAARFGGSAITEVVETVFGVDLVTMLIRELLGEPVDYPPAMLVDGSGAAAEMSLLGTNSAGVPWRSAPVWDSRTAELSRLVSPGSHIRHVAGLTVADGTAIPAYEPARGITNCVGMLVLTAPTAEQLLADTYAVLDGLEARLVEAGETPC